MENNEKHIEQDDIANIEQFQVGRAPQEAKEEPQNDLTKRSDDAGYTEQEKPFADGEGTQLDEAIDKQEDGKREDGQSQG